MMELSGSTELKRLSHKAFTPFYPSTHLPIYFLFAQEIPFDSQVLAVADTLEALTSHRPSPPAFDYHTALNFIAPYANILFDPRVIEGCFSLADRNIYPFSSQ